MKIVKEEFNYTLEVKKSKFISFLLPYDNFKNRLNQLKTIHSKANHIVFAYRYLNKYNQIVENSTDDNEPRYTAGKPTLKVMQGVDLINSAIITIRYFGGILLGSGGLVKAYSNSANLVVKNSILYDYKYIYEFVFSVSYDKTREVEYLFKKYDIFVVDRNFASNSIEYRIRDDIEKINIIKGVL